MIWARSKVAARSSISVNRGDTPASSGNRRSRAAQNEWMVWMRRPPGVSTAVANRVRARARRSVGNGPSTPRSTSAARRASSGSIAHDPSRLNSRFCISDAAALV